MTGLLGIVAMAALCAVYALNGSGRDITKPRD